MILSIGVLTGKHHRPPRPLSCIDKATHTGKRNVQFSERKLKEALSGQSNRKNANKILKKKRNDRLSECKHEEMLSGDDHGTGRRPS